MTEASDALCVDGVVLPMGADEPDADDEIKVVDPDHNAILVAQARSAAHIGGLIYSQSI
jgi:hypothetical protein